MKYTTYKNSFWLDIGDSSVLLDYAIFTGIEEDYGSDRDGNRGRKFIVNDSVKFKVSDNEDNLSYDEIEEYLLGLGVDYVN